MLQCVIFSICNHHELIGGCSLQPLLQTPVAVMGAAVTFLLVFRVNIGYERWWEGRRTFRDVANHSRDLARQITSQISDWYIAEKMLRWLIATIYMLKRYVREDDYVEELRGLLSDSAVTFLEHSRNKPLACAQRLSELLYACMASNCLFPDLVPTLDVNVSDMVNCVGTCEMCAFRHWPVAFPNFCTAWVILLCGADNFLGSFPHECLTRAGYVFSKATVCCGIGCCPVLPGLLRALRLPSHASAFFDCTWHGGRALETNMSCLANAGP
jgi:predicted membrane chloride channel (bestrophin family)